MNTNLVIPAISVDAWKKKPAPAKKDEEPKEEKGGKKLREPGAVEIKLRKKMGDALADIFDAVGTKAYQNLIASAADKIATDLAAHSKELRSQIMMEHGKTGLRQAVEFIHEWATTIAHDIMQNAPDQITEKVEAAIKGNFEAKDDAVPEGVGTDDAAAAPDATAEEPAAEEAPAEEAPAKDDKAKKEAAAECEKCAPAKSDESAGKDESDSSKSDAAPAPKEASVATKKEAFSKTRERAVQDLSLMEQALHKFSASSEGASKSTALKLAKKAHRVARHLKKI